MAEVFWLDEAADQLDRIVAYIDIFDPTAAERMARKLVALGESLSDFPNRGRPGRNGTREMTAVLPYVLQYEAETASFTSSASAMARSVRTPDPA